MVAPSKIFLPPINSYHCSQSIIHPGVGCFPYFLKNILIHSICSLKYFSPLLITPLVLKHKSMNRELFLQIVKHYLQTVLGGSLATTFVFVFICCFRNLLGSFRKYTTLFLPAALACQFCWFFPKRVLQLFTTATSQAMLESLLLQYSNKFTHLILHSPLVQTALFMVNSAIVLYFKRKHVYKGFWFIQPHGKHNEPTKSPKWRRIDFDEKVGADNCKTNCDHANVSCGKFLLDGVASYIFYGLPLDLLSMFLKGGLANQRAQNSLQMVMGKVKTFRPYMTLFFMSYIGIYRLSSCLLRKYYSSLSLDLQHLMSAFLGGISFIFVKRVNILSLSLVISIQLLWQQFCDSIRTTKNGRKPNVVLEILKNIPMSPIIFSINGGYLVHNYLFNYHLLNNSSKGFLDGITRDKPKNIRNFIINNSLQSLIEMAKEYPAKIFL